MKQIETNLTSMEVAEMMGMRHQKILEKLDGSKTSKGIITVLTEHDFVLSDYFQESTYTDSSGKENKCYKISRMGCDFLANKFTGEKGIIFTAKYIQKFHEMENVILNGTARKIKATSDTLLPPPSDWYSKNNKRMEMICAKYNITRKNLYHLILTHVGNEFDLASAEAIYIDERGFKPKYALDIIKYFPQLQEVADKYINYLLED